MSEEQTVRSEDNALCLWARNNHQYSA